MKPVGAKTLNMSNFNFDTQYGKQALDEVMNWIKNTVEVSMFRKINRSKSFTKELVSLIVEDSNLRNWLLLSIRENDLAQMIEEEPIPFALLSKVWLYCVGIDVLEKGVDVKRFLNRILGLEVEKQNLLFNAFLDRLDTITRKAKQDGTYDTGVKELAGGHVYERTQPEVLYRTETMQTLLHTIEVDRGIPWSDIEVVANTIKQEQKEVGDRKQEEKQEQAQHLGSRHKNVKISTVKFVTPGFYLSKRGFQGMHFIIYAQEKVDVREIQSSNILCFRPQTGKHELLRTSFYDKYDKVSDEKAKSMWISEFSLNTKRVVTWYMLSGAVLPIWTAIAEALRVANAPVRIMRAVLKMWNKDTPTPSTLATSSNVVDNFSTGGDSPEKGNGDCKQQASGDCGDTAAVIGIWLPTSMVEDVSLVFTTVCVILFIFKYRFMSCPCVYLLFLSKAKRRIGKQVQEMADKLQLSDAQGKVDKLEEEGAGL